MMMARVATLSVARNVWPQRCSRM